MSEVDWGLLQNNPIGQQSAAFNYADAVSQNAAKYRAGAQFAKGDYQGAATTQAQAGDIPAAEASKNFGNTIFQQQHEYIGRAVPIFQSIYQNATAQANGDTNAGTQAVVKAFGTIAPDLKQLGVPDDKIAQYGAALQSDTPGTLQALTAVTARKFSYQKLGDDSIGVFDDNTGQLIGTHQGTQFIHAPPSENIYQVGGQSGSTPAGTPAQQPAPQSVAAPAPPAQPQAATTPAAAPGDALFGQQPVKPTAVSMVESGNNPNAVSPKGATGTMQTMAPTLANPGFGVTPAKDNSPEEQARVGTDYLGALQQKYGNPTLALVAYNMGPGATDAWLKAGGNFKALPQETKEYLGHVAVTQATGQGGGLGAPNLGPQASAAPAPAAAAGPVSAQAAPAPNGVTILQHGQPVWRAPTPEELKQYPGASQINANGEVKYPPVSALGASLDDQQIQPYVDILKAGGIIPQRIAGNPALYTRVLKLANDQGVAPADFLANQGNRKATQQTFSNVNTRYAMVQTQEQAFQNSLNLAYSLAQKAGPQGGGTLINGWRNYIKTGIAGDPATGAFVNAVNTAMNEYGKIIEGSTGNGGSSISAREDANSMLSAADNLPAFIQKMQVLQQDAGFKIGALKDQHDTLLATLHGIGQGDQAGTAAPSKVIDFNSLPKK